jgi:hypothetical protein
MLNLDKIAPTHWSACDGPGQPWHAVLGNYEPAVGASAQRLCDQQLLGTREIVHGEPTCEACLGIIVRMESLKDLGSSKELNGKGSDVVE